eukprot:16588_1
MEEFKEFKEDVKYVQSPPHIFDNKLFDQWPDVENDKFDLNSNSEHKSKNEEEKKISFDFEVSESNVYSIDYESGIFCMKWSPDGQYLAVGCADGGVRILHGADGRLAHRLKTSGNMPVTAMKWKPSLSNVGSSNCLMTTSCSGCIDIWHVQSANCIYSINEENNQIFAFDISPVNGSSHKFASAGKDKIIRIYDDETKKLVCSLEKGFMAKHVGHSNRIFALKWKPDDSNILISGGWDNCVLIWDLRSKNCFRSIFGPHIAGQTIDIQNDKIVTGSWRIHNTIQTFEFSTGKEIKQDKKIQWDPSPMIYTLSYSPLLEGVIAAGGTGVNTMRIVNTNNGHMSPSMHLKNKGGIYCLDWEPKSNILALAGQSSDISLISLK